MGVACDVAHDDLMRTFRDVFGVLRRDPEGNKERICQLALDLEAYRAGRHPRCAAGAVVDEVEVLPSPPPVIQATEEERAAGILVDVQHRPKRRRTGRTAASAAVVVPGGGGIVCADAGAGGGGGGRGRVRRRRDDARRLPRGRDRRRASADRPAAVAQRLLLHGAPRVRPGGTPALLGLISQQTRAFEYGAQHVHADAPGTWRFEKIRTFWTHADPDTGRTRVSALVVNEVHEPRWGELLLLDTAVSRADEERVRDLLESEIPCFLTRKGQYNDIRYCGHWTFRAEREVPSFLYVTNSRPRSRALRMQLARYDDRWGATA